MKGIEKLSNLKELEYDNNPIYDYIKLIMIMMKAIGKTILKIWSSTTNRIMVPRSKVFAGLFLLSSQSVWVLR